MSIDYSKESEPFCQNMEGNQSIIFVNSENRNIKIIGYITIY